MPTPKVLGLGQRTGVECQRAVGRTTPRTPQLYGVPWTSRRPLASEQHGEVTPVQLATYAATIRQLNPLSTHFVKAIAV